MFRISTAQAELSIEEELGAARDELVVARARLEVETEIAAKREKALRKVRASAAQTPATCPISRCFAVRSWFLLTSLLCQTKRRLGWNQLRLLALQHRFLRQLRLRKQAVHQLLGSQRPVGRPPRLPQRRLLCRLRGRFPQQPLLPRRLLPQRPRRRRRRLHL